MPNQGTDCIQESSMVPGVWAVFWLTFFTVMGTLSGFLREIVVAYLYGTSAAADGYVVVIQYYNIFYTLMLSGIAGLAVIPYLAKARENGREASGIGAVLTLSGWLAAFAIVISLLLIVFADPITRSLLPGFNSEQLSNTSSLIRICAMGMAPLLVSTILLTILQYYYRFNAVPFGRIAFNVCFVLAALSLSGIWGINGVGVGILAGILAQLALAVAIALKRGLHWRPARLFAPAQLDILRMMFIPLLVVLISNFLYAIVEYHLLSGMGIGKVSGVKYAQRIVSIMIGLNVAIQTVYFARAGRQPSEGGKKQIELADKTIRMGALVMAPASFILAMIADPFVRVLFERGSFGVESTAVTAAALSIYALAVVGGFVWGMVVRTGFITGTRGVSLMTVVVLFVVGAAFNIWAVPWMGYLAIPTAFTI